jgi:hypothetical protein
MAKNMPKPSIFAGVRARHFNGDPASPTPTIESADVCYDRGMTKTPAPDDPEQFKRFLQTAHDLEAERGTSDVFDRVLEGVARSSRPKPMPKTRRPRKPKWGEKG